ncbi:tigger transposable element-derived protein 4 [Elysia marginata]|uniref:Tigger transposable element-derived protein 4 n=1 Tax=Elysia marginata TaxID=1093978 RepID=A0AAV4F4F9_9GAST|nr:tigger transposable element-derived protein 4 [Elysia marginata]
MRSSVETGFGLTPCLVPSSSVPTLTYRPSARPTLGGEVQTEERNNIRVISGEAAAAPKDEAQNWASNALQKILKAYCPEDVYNADEMGLFFQCLPVKTLALKDETCRGGRN